MGPYVLIARLGAGGMGQVFLGRTRGGRTVAVKVVKAELAGDREFRRRFRQEVAAARLVSGRFTAAVVDADPEAATPWLATAYVSGLTLRAVVSSGARLPETSLRVLAYGLARALAEIHTAGVVHRDMKPSNVMLAVDGPHVIDFGISRVIAATDLTRTDIGTIVGSPGFMSPEQTRGQLLTGATDVFSLGTVLAYAATGRNPFGDGPEHALLYRITHGEPDLTGVPDSLAPLITMCLAKEPAQRPSTAQIIGRMADSVPEGAWLPADLTAAIAQSAAEILDYEGIAVFPQPDHDPLTTPSPSPDPTLPLPTTANAPTARIETVGEPVPEPFGERTPERVGVGHLPQGSRGGGAGGAGLVAGLLSVAVIAALATALVLVLRTGDHNPDTPPTASIGTTSSQSPQTRSVGATATSQTSTTAPSPTTASSPTPTTPAPTTQTTSQASPSTSTSASTSQSAPPSTTPSSSASSSAPPSSSPSTAHSSAAQPTQAASSHT